MSARRRTSMMTKVGAMFLAAALLAGCGGGSVPEDNPLVPASTGGTTTTADNIAATHAESHRLLTVLTPPSGGKVVTSSPVPDLRQSQLGIGPSDPKFSEHAWWTVPMSPDAFAAWLNAQHVAGMASEDGGSSSVPSGAMMPYFEFEGTDTAAYVRPVLNFGWLPYDGGVAVRLDTFTGARFARSVLVPDDTMRVTIRRTTKSYAPHAKVRVKRAAVTDPRGVRRLVAAANALGGAMTTPFVGSCPAQLSQKTYVVAFTGPHGTFSISGDDSSCWPTLTLRQEGSVVPPRLDPGRRWFPLLGI